MQHPLAGPASFTGTILELVHANDIAPAHGTAYPQVSLEQLLAARAE